MSVCSYRWQLGGVPTEHAWVWLSETWPFCQVCGEDAPLSVAEKVGVSKKMSECDHTHQGKSLGEPWRCLDCGAEIGGSDGATEGSEEAPGETVGHEAGA